MENFKWFDKWYSKHVIEHHKEKAHFKIENSKEDHSWKLTADLTETEYKHIKYMNEAKKISDYNYYRVDAKEKNFYAEGDFTKLDFLIGKLRVYIGEIDHASYGNDFFLNPDIQKYIFEDEKNSKIYLHYTSEKDVVEKISKNGFEFLAFDKTTTPANNNPIDISYNHMIRKPYGKFIVVISISKKIFNKYSSLINKSQKKDLKVEEVLSEKAPYKVDFGENVFTLHHKFVKGFINYSTGEIFKNTDFDRNYDKVQFEEQI